MTKSDAKIGTAPGSGLTGAISRRSLVKLGAAAGVFSAISYASPRMTTVSAMPAYAAVSGVGGSVVPKDTGTGISVFMDKPSFEGSAVTDTLIDFESLPPLAELATLSEIVMNNNVKFIKIGGNLGSAGSIGHGRSLETLLVPEKGTPLVARFSDGTGAVGFRIWGTGFINETQNTIAVTAESYNGAVKTATISPPVEGGFVGFDAASGIKTLWFYDRTPGGGVNFQIDDLQYQAGSTQF